MRVYWEQKKNRIFFYEQTKSRCRRDTRKKTLLKLHLKWKDIEVKKKKMDINLEKPQQLDQKKKINSI